MQIVCLKKVHPGQGEYFEEQGRKKKDQRLINLSENNQVSLFFNHTWYTGVIDVDIGSVLPGSYKNYLVG